MRVLFARSLGFYHSLSVSFLDSALLRPRIVNCRFSTATQQVPVNTPLTPPQPSGEEKKYDQKIVKIVDDISKLTLFEVSELNDCLKKTLNIIDTPMMAVSQMPAQSQSKEEEEEQVVKAVQTAFTLKLVKFDETKKVPLIKEVKNIVEGMNLVQAKKFVESAPQTLKSNLTQDEAEKLKTALEAVGGICTVE